MSANLTADGSPDLAGVLLCSAGGVTWPELVLVYGTGPTLLGYLDLGDVVQVEHSDVTSITAEGNDLRVIWRSYEGCCFDEETHSGILQWNGSEFVMQSHT